MQKTLILSTSDQDITSKTIPTRKQLSNRKHYLKHKDLPTGDAVKNIILMHNEKQTGFLQEVTLYPSVGILLATTKSLALLQLRGQRHVLIDSTFDLCEGKLVLTTLMVIVSGITSSLLFE